jgi:ssDNA-binding Zn-finger/Zn-ribbon topoisomerase 1
LAKRCPQCDAAFVVQKVSRAGVRLRCLAEGCGWTAEPDADEDGPATPDAKAS